MNLPPHFPPPGKIRFIWNYCPRNSQGKAGKEKKTTDL